MTEVLTAEKRAYIEGVFNESTLIRELLRLYDAALARAPSCEHCGKPAACLGCYEMAGVFSYACGECCGHGNEDGRCFPIADVPSRYDAALARADLMDRLATDHQKEKHEVQNKLADALARADAATSDLAEMRTERDDAIEERDELVKYNTRLGEEHKAALARAEAADATGKQLSASAWRAECTERGKELVELLARAEAAEESQRRMRMTCRVNEADNADQLERRRDAESRLAAAEALLRRCDGLWETSGESEPRQGLHNAVMAFLSAAQAQAARLKPLALTEDRTPEQLAADGDAPAQEAEPTAAYVPREMPDYWRKVTEQAAEPMIRKPSTNTWEMKGPDGERISFTVPCGQASEPAPECTGFAASWCPKCGDCSCPRIEGERQEESDACALHADNSPHAESPPPEHPDTIALRECRAELERTRDVLGNRIADMQHEASRLGQAHRQLLESARADLATTRSALAEIHALAGRGEGHGSVDATVACIADSIISRSVDAGETERELETARARIAELEDYKAMQTDAQAMHDGMFALKCREATELQTRIDQAVAELESALRCGHLAAVNTDAVENALAALKGETS